MMSHPRWPQTFPGKPFKYLATICKKNCSKCNVIDFGNIKHFFCLSLISFVQLTIFLQMYYVQMLRIKTMNQSRHIPHLPGWIYSRRHSQFSLFFISTGGKKCIRHTQVHLISAKSAHIKLNEWSKVTSSVG